MSVSTAPPPQSVLLTSSILNNFSTVTASVLSPPVHLLQKHRCGRCYKNMNHLGDSDMNLFNFYRKIWVNTFQLRWLTTCVYLFFRLSFTEMIAEKYWCITHYKWGWWGDCRKPGICTWFWRRMDAGQKGCSLKCAGTPHRGGQLPVLKDEKSFVAWKNTK